jgi:DHA1 family tetracycline resistance protein-like MFS transporter
LRPFSSELVSEFVFMGSSKGRNALTFVFITLLIDVIGISIIIPVMPTLIEQLIHGDVSVAAKYNGWLMLTYALMQFVFSPVLGGLSDRYGRRPILLISLLGLGIDYVFLAMAPSIAWLFIGRAIAGIAGASFTTASAYIADVSTPEKRAQNFGLIGVAFGVGFILGPVIGGIASDWGPRAPFWLSAGLSMVNFLYGFFVFPESLAKENRRAFNWKRANAVGSLLQLRKYPVVSGMVISLTLVYIAAHAVQSTWSFFTIFKFGWSEKIVGYSLGLVGLLIAVVQGGLIRVAIPKLGKENAVLVGLALYAIGMFLFSFANQSWMMFAILIPYCLGGIAGPALQGIISGEVAANEQGELQGGLTALMSVTSIIGPLLMNNLFSYFSSKNAPVYFPGAPFLLGGLLMIASILFAWPKLKKSTDRLEGQVGNTN